MTRSGEAGARSLEWTSKYGSLIVSGYDIATVDGMNEAGLVANMLWMVATEYPGDDAVDLVVALGTVFHGQLRHRGRYAGQPLPSGVQGSADAAGAADHGASVLSDASGDNAILEWLDGELVIHHGPQYRVMTNDPPYDEQLALVSYWQGVNPHEVLPGTTRAADRFVRASTYIDVVVQSDNPRIAAAAFSVIRNASVPYGIGMPEAPNLAATRWRGVADQKDWLFYVESAISPNVLWVDLKQLDFAEDSGVRMRDLGLDMANLQSCEVSGQFAAAEPFRFEAAE